MRHEVPSSQETIFFKTDYFPKNMELDTFLSPAEFDRRFASGDLVIAHAGMGSITASGAAGVCRLHRRRGRLWLPGFWRFVSGVPVAPFRASRPNFSPLSSASRQHVSARYTRSEGVCHSSRKRPESE
jgi:hypothetical protein